MPRFNNPLVERLLSEGNWSAAMSAANCPIDTQVRTSERIVQLAGTMGLDPKRFKVHRRTYDGYETDTPQYYLYNEGNEKCILIYLGMRTDNIGTCDVYEMHYNPVVCIMQDVCTCDGSFDDDGDEVECANCQYGSDWCSHHNTYH